MSQKLVATLFLCCLVSFVGAQIRVSPNGNGNGKTWSQAMNLGDALKIANSGVEIWLVKGTYYPTTCTQCSDSDRMKTFALPNGVKLYGGFEGNETSSSQRNWNLNKTILSGDIDQDGTPANNSYSVVFSENVNEFTELNGLTIRDGNADSDDPVLEMPSRSGGGWYNGGLGTPMSNPQIKNCIFENNRANGFGGAMYNMASLEGQANPNYENCIFRNNQSQYDGGSIYSNGSFGGESNFTMTHCRFEDNFAGWEVGGAAALFNNGIEGVCSPVITNCQFIRQKATLHGGAIYNHGKSGESSPIITNCVFYQNEAIQAGAIYNLGVFPGGKSSPIITNCTFYGNVAYDFGGVSTVNGDVNGESRPFFRNCIFSENVGRVKGDIFYKINGHPTLEYCLVDEPSCGNMYSALSNLSEMTCGDGVLYNMPPKFVDPANGDLRLKHNSAALDVGQDSFNLFFDDVDGAPRVLLDQIDLGAFEYTGPRPTRMDTFHTDSYRDFISINWVTFNEFENAGFEIQRSRDSIDYEPIGWIPSQGNSAQRQFYQAWDTPPQRGEIYTYRLQQFDTDGCFEFYGKDTAFIKPDQVIVKLFPSPAEDVATLKVYFPRPDANDLQIYLTNVLGQTVLMKEDRGQPEGWSIYDIDVSAMATGINYITVFANKEKHVLSFMKAYH